MVDVCSKLKTGSNFFFFFFFVSLPFLPPPAPGSELLRLVEESFWPFGMPKRKGLRITGRGSHDVVVA